MFTSVLLMISHSCNPDQGLCWLVEVNSFTHEVTLWVTLRPEDPLVPTSIQMGFKNQGYMLCSQEYQSHIYLNKDPDSTLSGTTSSSMNFYRDTRNWWSNLALCDLRTDFPIKSQGPNLLVSPQKWMNPKVWEFEVRLADWLSE